MGNVDAAYRVDAPYRKEKKMLKYGILGLLSYGEMSGYEIMETFKSSLVFFWKATTSQIYRELKVLEEKGWAEKTVVIQHKKPDKNVFHITQAGKAELARWLSSPSEDVARNPLLMKVFFFAANPIEENRAFFRRLEAESMQAARILEAVPQFIDQYAKEVSSADAMYWKMTLDFGFRYQEMMRQWAAACLDTLQNELSSSQNNPYEDTPPESIEADQEELQ